MTDVEIHDDGPLTREQIIAATNIHEGKNIFTINLSAARKGLMALPQVDRAELERLLPNKISIDIAERKPVAWLTAKEMPIPATTPAHSSSMHKGALMQTKKQLPEYYHLPVIYGVATDNLEAGQVLMRPR